MPPWQEVSRQGMQPYSCELNKVCAFLGTTSLAGSPCCLHPCDPWSALGVACHRESHPSSPHLPFPREKPSPKCQCNILGLSRTRLSPCWAELTASQASSTPRSHMVTAPLWCSSKALSQGWHTLLHLPCRDANFHTLKLKC